MGRMHWGGGTPTILAPAMIHCLAQAVKAVFPPTDDWEFSVEIDPTMVDRAKIDALAAEGINRSSIGIQDFDPLVQKSIGRLQPFDITRACVDDLRAAGVRSLNTELVYGLPHQTAARLQDTVDRVLDLDPDRVALFGYAHVPWVSKRQKLIPEEALPAEEARHDLATLAAARFTAAGLTPIGIDHFARSSDGLERAAATGHLRRNFQGYVDDSCATLIGLGASSISRLPTGYVQNAPATAAYVQRIKAGQLAGARGHMMTEDDLLRARAIEMLMCDFRLDRAGLCDRFGPLAGQLDAEIALVADRFGNFVTVTDEALEIAPAGRPLTRIIASAFDAHVPDGMRYSQAS